MLLRTLIARLKKKELHAAHTVPKPETDNLHIQEDLNSTLYAHVLINLNSTHNDCNIREALNLLRVYVAGMFELHFLFVY